MPDAAESLPPPRPTQHHNSRTRRFGGSRSAISRNNTSSSGVIESAKAALMTLIQRAQLGPAKPGDNTPPGSIAAAGDAPRLGTGGLFGIGGLAGRTVGRVDGADQFERIGLRGFRTLQAKLGQG